VPTSELVVVPGGAHGFMVEHAGRFTTPLRAFLDRVSREDQLAA